MGSILSLKPEEKLERINMLHKNIELIMKIKSDINVLSRGDKNNIISTYDYLMKCMFFEQVTENRLLDCLNNHIDEWQKLNNVTIDKNKYVEEKHSHMKKYLEIYMLKVLSSDR